MENIPVKVLLVLLIRFLPEFMEGTKTGEGFRPTSK
jgi:hypothetical protein